MNLVDRLRLLGANRVANALAPEEMDRLASFFEEAFNISQPRDGWDLLQTLIATLGEERARALDSLMSRRTQGSDRERPVADREFYAQVADQPLLGLMHSTKFPFVFDAAAYLTVLVRSGGVERIVDLGAGAGYHALWLSRFTRGEVVGLDACGPGLDFARRTAEARKLRARFVDVALPSIPPDLGLFDLAYSVDGPVQLTFEWLTMAFRLIVSDGVFVWIGNTKAIPGKKLQRILRTSGLTLILSDVVGGWNGKEYAAKSLLVLARGGEPNVGDDHDVRLTEVWHRGFRDYANAPGRRSDRKSIAWYRTYATFG